MDRGSEPFDDRAMTQPIPVISRVTPAAAVAAPAVTPQAAPFAHRFGSMPLYLGARFAAFVLDVFGLGFVLATFAFHSTSALFTIAADATGFATLAGVSLAVASLLAYLSEAIFGTTLGKLLFALHVRRTDGRHAGAARVLVRTLVRPLDLVAIGPLLAALLPRRQRLGDVVAGTVVSHSRLGAFGSVLAVLAWGGVGYLQAAYGGGLDSAAGVAAETAQVAPALVTTITKTFGIPAIVPHGDVPHVRSGGPDPTPAPLASGSIQ
ncbi:MAG: hypothetical protein NVS3B7_11490 [Candidatus Elarobacter sp.]